MEIKKEPVSAPTETSPKNEISPDISSCNYTPSQTCCQVPARVYEFDGGAVRLEYAGGRYRVFIAGEEQTSVQNDVPMSNPYIAVMRFTDCIGAYMHKRVKSYLRARGYNEIMGCKIDLPCEECRAYKFNTADSLCRVGGENP